MAKTFDIVILIESKSQISLSFSCSQIVQCYSAQRRNDIWCCSMFESFKRFSTNIIRKVPMYNSMLVSMFDNISLTTRNKQAFQIYKKIFVSYFLLLVHIFVHETVNTNVHKTHIFLTKLSL